MREMVALRQLARRRARLPRRGFSSNGRWTDARH